MGTSLATTEPVFSFLGEIPTIDRERPKWHCTGEYLQRLRPDVYRAAVDMLCEPGVSVRSICRALHVSHNTLASIEEREAANLDTRKKGVLRTVTRGLRLCAERVEELAPDMSAKDAIIGVGVLTEKMELLSGNATQRIESIDGGRKLHAQFLELHETLMKQANVIEIDPNMGDAGRNDPAKAPALLDRNEPGDSPPIKVESDSQSDVQTDLPKESASDPAELPAKHATASYRTAAQTGAGGVASLDPPPPSPNP